MLQKFNTLLFFSTKSVDRTPEDHIRSTACQNFLLCPFESCRLRLKNFRNFGSKKYAAEKYCGCYCDSP